MAPRVKRAGVVSLIGLRQRAPDYEEGRGTVLKGHVLEKLGMCSERDVDVFGTHVVLYALARDTSV